MSAKSKPNKVLFVCLGNICRSPMAEGVFRHLASSMQLTMVFDSCGTGGWHSGEAPDPRARDCMMRHGMPIDDLRARQFRPSDFQEFDLIFAMDVSNQNDILSMARTADEAGKVKLLLAESKTSDRISVPDPYYGDESDFEAVFTMLQEAAHEILPNLNS